MFKFQPTDVIARNFLEAVDNGKIVDFGTHALWIFEGDDTDEVTMLVAWAVYEDLLDWPPFQKHLNVRALNEAGEARLAELRDRIAGRSR